MPLTSRDLPARLRALRERTWEGLAVTQKQLAEAFSGAGDPASGPLISSWENSKDPKSPPLPRLEQYARFFATERSFEGMQCRLLPVDDLTAKERTRYDELLAELIGLRSALVGQHDGAARPVPKGLWHFPDGYDILIVCTRSSRKFLHATDSVTDPRDSEYAELYTYADLDALIEVFGHIRAMNPDSAVNFVKAEQLTADDFTKHLVLLGGVDWNALSRELPARVGIPVQQITWLGADEPGGFKITDSDDSRMFTPTMESGVLVEDVAHFYRGANPFNVARTVTVCNGMFGRGTYGAARALTDVKFRERNDHYIREQLDRHAVFSLLMRVQVLGGVVVTPDLTVAETRLHEWPES